MFNRPMDVPPIVSNYTRAEPPAKMPSLWWYLLPAVLLPLCMGSFLTSQDVWLDPAASLRIVGEYPSRFERDVAQTISVLAAVVCGIVISTKRALDIFKALGIYFVGFVLWGTAFLTTYGQPGVNSKMGLEPLLLSGIFGMGTLVVVVGPGVFVLWLFVWMFRRSRELVGDRSAIVVEEEAAGVMMIGSTQGDDIESLEYVSVERTSSR